MAVHVGYQGSVKLGTTTIAEMGSWSMDGITNDLLDATAFGDSYKEYVLGLGDYGSVSFNGWFDSSDSTGQTMLRSYHSDKFKFNSLRLYIDNTNYWTPNTSTTTGGVTTAGVLLQTISIAFDKAGIGTINFTAKCTGPMILK